MLKQISGDRFQADAGEQIQIVARSRNNDGVNDARFEYASSVLPRSVIQGLPGASFTVRNGRQQFQAVVMFADNAAATARYDLFEVDEVGGLSDLGQFVTADDSSPLAGFAVEGVPAVSVLAPAGGRRRRAPGKTARKAKTTRTATKTGRAAAGSKKKTASARKGRKTAAAKRPAKRTVAKTRKAKSRRAARPK